ATADGADHGTKLEGHGLPTHELGKIGLAISKSNPNRVYALIETGDGNPLHGRPTDNGELWRSEDGGVNWKVISFDRDLACRQPYYTRMAVAPDNPDETYFLCATFNHSLDGGTTLTQTRRGGGGGRGRGGPPPAAEAGGAAGRGNPGAAFTSPGGDNHDIWIDPNKASRIVVGKDAGLHISTTRGRTWLHGQLPIAQIYHATVDTRVPYNVYGNKQDGPSYPRRANSRHGAQS